MQEAHQWGTKLIFINARMSQRSLTRWQNRPKMIVTLLSLFSFVCTQSKETQKYLRMLGVSDALFLGNLKFALDPLPFDKKEVEKLKKTIGHRPFWLASSTHETSHSEEIQIARAHQKI